MTKLSENILQTINKAQVKPVSRWKFLAKNWFAWITFGVSLSVGAVAFAVILDLMMNYDWDIYTYLHKTFFQFVLFSLPYVWIGMLLLFVGVACWDFFRIKGWYRFKLYAFVASSFIWSVGLGSILFFTGLGKSIDVALTKNVPLYKASMVDTDKLWAHPEDGLLEGQIVKIEGTGEFVLQDPSGKKWRIQDGDNDSDDKNFVEGEIVKIIGDKEAEDKFVAKNIRENKSEKTEKIVKKEDIAKENNEKENSEKEKNKNHDESKDDNGESKKKENNEEKKSANDGEQKDNKEHN